MNTAVPCSAVSERRRIAQASSVAFWSLLTLRVALGLEHALYAQPTPSSIVHLRSVGCSLLPVA